ncbi:MAG: hypothetical protein HY673_23265 [Chloroflexi bacterium]|nr:hypothetical protein [Chloroflexota bacterium]
MKNIPTLIGSLLAAIALIMVIVLPVIAQQPALPDPPPRGTIEGPPPPRDTTSHAGGILFVKDSEQDWTEPQNQYLGEIHCNDNDLTYTRTVKNKTGLSIMGPISGEQTTGITDAIQSLRDPAQVVLTYVMDGRAGFKREWTLTGIKFHLTRYRILAVRQAVPAQNELIGYFDVSRPVSLEVTMTETPHPTPAVPGMTVPKAPPGVKQSYTFTMVPGGADIKPEIPARSFFDIFLDMFQPPEKPIGSIFDYGRVTVHSGGGLAGAGFVGLGETLTLRLPPGSYEVKASISVLGIPLNVDAGSASASVPIILSVTLAGVEVIWYIMVILAGVCGLAIVLVGIRVLTGAVFRGKGPSGPAARGPIAPVQPPQRPTTGGRATPGAGGATMR